LISITITADAGPALSLLAKIEGKIQNRAELHQQLGEVLAEKLKENFQRKNAEPNRFNAGKTGFWGQVADATVVSRADESGATVSISKREAAPHIFGGVIKPKEKRFLTIPLVAAARGETVASYQAKTGSELFRVKGKFALFEKNGEELRAVYALRTSVTIRKDETAVPSDIALRLTLQEAADEYVNLINNQAT
jgi:hypothetical protein